MAHEPRDQHRIHVGLAADPRRRNRSYRQTPQMLIGARVHFPHGGCGLFFIFFVREFLGAFLHFSIHAGHVQIRAALQPVVDQQVAVQVCDQMRNRVGHAGIDRFDRRDHARVVAQISRHVNVVPDFMREHFQRVMLQADVADRVQIDHHRLVQQPDRGDFAVAQARGLRIVPAVDLRIAQHRERRPRGERARPRRAPVRIQRVQRIRPSVRRARLDQQRRIGLAVLRRRFRNDRFFQRGAFSLHHNAGLAGE